MHAATPVFDSIWADCATMGTYFWCEPAWNIPALTIMQACLPKAIATATSAATAPDPVTCNCDCPCNGRRKQILHPNNALTAGWAVSEGGHRRGFVEEFRLSCELAVTSVFDTVQLG